MTCLTISSSFHIFLHANLCTASKFMNLEISAIDKSSCSTLNSLMNVKKSMAIRLVIFLWIFHAQIVSLVAVGPIHHIEGTWLIGNVLVVCGSQDTLPSCIHFVQAEICLKMVILIQRVPSCSAQREVDLKSSSILLETDYYYIT